jgi:hypothetical protein
MGFFKRRQPFQVAPMPISEPLAPTTCVCGATIQGDLNAHIDTHIFTMATAAGHPARAFDCPLCGPSDSAWGSPGEHPISLTNMSRFIFREHCKEAHGVDL